MIGTRTDPVGLLKVKFSCLYELGAAPARVSRSNYVLPHAWNTCYLSGKLARSELSYPKRVLVEVVAAIAPADNADAALLAAWPNILRAEGVPL